MFLGVMDLFKFIVPEERLHQNFKSIVQSSFYTPEIEVINGWAEGFLDRDNKFVKEFQTTFNSSFWELYLFACFKELGFSVDFSYNTPDFLVNSSQGEFIAEATIASHPDGFRPEWDKDLESLKESSREDILRLSTIRLSNAISSKYKKYTSEYSKLSHVQNKPFVICVAPFDQAFFSSQDSLAIVRLLYAYEATLTIPGNQKGENIIVGESRCFRVQKSPGVDLELGLFTNSQMANVSAVFFNVRATFSKVRALAKKSDDLIIFSGLRMIQLANLSGSQPFCEIGQNYQETILDGLHVLINPFAKHPIDIRMFEGREVAIHNYDPETGNYLSKIPHGFLLQRMCNSIVSSETIMESKKTTNERPYKELSPEAWKEDELIYVGGQSDQFRDHHMAHYRGWTVLVSFDSIDKDWGTQAAHSLCYKIPQYITANMNEDIASTAVPKWFSTKEDAYVAIKQKIDQIFDHS
jgi:hypothetical protein